MHDDRRKVLIIGGYGNFGGRVARLLADEPQLALLIAGRNLHKAGTFCAQHKNRASMKPVEFDRDGNVAQQILDLSPDFVVDASGPFQAYGDDPYRVVTATIACGASYLDLADSSEFVAGIAKFDSLAAEKRVFALSGASTCISLSSTVFRRLSQDLVDVESMSGGIAPSPYAGVGYSVMQAVAFSAGKPVQSVRQNGVQMVYPFTDARRFVIAPPGHLPLRQRTYSLVDVPDLRLAKRIEPRAESIWFAAAPVPGIYHACLRALARAVKRGWIRSLGGLAPLMHRVMRDFAWGEHRGGMFIEVSGKSNSERNVTRCWHLLAEGDDGPSIPSIASAAIIRRCLDGQSPTPGARPAIGELQIDDFAYYFARMNIHTGEREEPVPEDWPVFRRVLGSAWHALPEEIREIHEVADAREFSGRASVSRGSSILARLIGWLIGLPPTANQVPLEVTMKNLDGREHWCRDFGGHAFSSVMSSGTGRLSHHVCEKFGPMNFAMALVPQDGRLNYRHRDWTFLGLPMPRMLGPKGKTHEYVKDGRFHFHVEITLPIAGSVVTYEGWLAARDDRG